MITTLPGRTNYQPTFVENSKRKRSCTMKFTFCHYKTTLKKHLKFVKCSTNAI